MTPSLPVRPYGPVPLSTHCVLPKGRWAAVPPPARWQLLEARRCHRDCWPVADLALFQRLVQSSQLLAAHRRGPLRCLWLALR